MDHHHDPTRSENGRPLRPIKVLADRDNDGRWQFTRAGFWSPSRLRRAEARHTAKWDPQAGVMYSVRDATLALAEVHAAFVGNDLARDLDHQGRLGQEAPTTFPVFASTGERVGDVRPPEAQALVDRSLATWVDARRSVLGLWMGPRTPEPTRDQLPAPSHVRKPRRPDPTAEDVFAHWVRRLPADRAEGLVLQAAFPSPARDPIPEEPDGHLEWAARTLLARLPDTVTASIPTRAAWQARIHHWVTAVRTGSPVTRALWSALEARQPPPSRTRGPEWGAER